MLVEIIQVALDAMNVRESVADLPGKSIVGRAVGYENRHVSPPENGKTRFNVNTSVRHVKC
jgi:hypothetical protein